uniref:Reverse transcriptase domain-containing protein n=1 Tax=Tanacetum cinerariifolium TaxID=118510 RepID=A0A699JBW2_TANCI|nr:hypothetical protein [Tanacetum cinerariifolium]
MAETMEQYMSKTRSQYGLGVARPKIEDKDNFELKGQFLKELRTNTFSGSNHEDANEHIEKVLEIVDLIHIPNVTVDQVMLRAFHMSLTGVASHWLRNKPSLGRSENKHNGTSTTRSTETSDGLAAIQAQLNNLGREIKKENFNLIKEIRALTDATIRNQRESIKTLKIQIGQMSKVLQERGFESLSSSTKTNLRDHVKSISTIVEVDSYLICHIGSHQYVVSTRLNSTLMYETRQTTILFLSHLNGYYCEEKKGSYGSQFLKAYSEASHINNSIPRKEKYLGSFTLPCFINNVCFDNALANLGASVSVIPLLTYLNLGLGKLTHTKLTVELADRTVKYRKGIAKNMLVCIGKFVFPVDFIILDMPEDIKVPLIRKRPFLSTAHAKIDVFKRNINLRVGEEKIIFKSIKPTSSLFNRERIKLDLEARLMGETLVMNRSLDPFFGDFIETKRS